jgi:probable phosphoglycerate mutase
MGLAAARDFRIPNCAINRLESGAQGWRIGCWGEEAHLEGALDDLQEGE